MKARWAVGAYLALLLQCCSVCVWGGCGGRQKEYMGAFWLTLSPFMYHYGSNNRGRRRDVL